LARELASLLALIEKMDEDIDVRGVTRRDGEARTIVALRLRASEKFKRTLEAYVDAKRNVGYPICETELIEPGDIFRELMAVPRQRTPE
jgi:hypothetical protein